MRTYLIVVCIALASLQKAYGQESNVKANELITSFLKEVYKSNNSSNEIAKKYVLLSEDNSTLSYSQRYNIASKHIDMLRKGESISTENKVLSTLSSLNKLSIVNYNSLAGDNIPPFSLDESQRKNVYVVMLNDNVFKYFYVKDNKILSFDYIKKGTNGPAYFFSY